MKTVFLILFSCGFIAYGQNNEDKAIKAVIQSLFDNMKKGDSATIRLLFEPDAELKTVMIDGQGISWVESQPLDTFLKRISAVLRGNMDIEEKMISCRIQTDLPMANAWVEYVFYIKGKPSHSGVNSITLYKSLSGWKIIDICDTRRKTR